MSYRFYRTVPQKPFAAELWRVSRAAGCEQVTAYDWTAAQLPETVEELTKKEAQSVLDLMKGDRTVAPWVPLEGYAKKEESSGGEAVLTREEQVQWRILLGFVLIFALLLLWHWLQLRL